MNCEPAHQRDRVLVGADGGRPRARQSEVDLVERAALPAQREVGGRLIAIDLDRDVFDEGAQQLFPVARCGRWRGPDGGEIRSDSEETIALGLRDHPRPLFFAALQLDLGHLNCAQALLPVAFEAARYQPVVGIDSAIATLGALRFVIGSLDPEPPRFKTTSRSASSRSAAARVAASPAGSRAATKVRVTASSIWVPPILRQ